LDLVRRMEMRSEQVQILQRGGERRSYDLDFRAPHL